MAFYAVNSLGTFMKKKAKTLCLARFTDALQFHAHDLSNLQRLSHAQIQHDLFATTRDSIGPDVSIQALDLATLATARV